VDSVVGIDLSGASRSAKSRTVAAQLAVADPPRLLSRVTVRPGRAGDRDLVEWVVARRPRVVAIDAPLTLPHSVICTENACPRCEPGTAEYLSRDVDRLVAGMPTAMLAAIAFRGIYLARYLGERGLQVIETYPAASYRAIGAGVGYADRAAAVGRRIGSFEWTLQDEVDAVCAALAGVDYLDNGRATVTRGQDGAIWLAVL